AQLRARNAVQQHVRSHLADFVALHLLVTPQGILVDPSWRGSGWRQRYEVYVDPRDGVLKRSRSDKARHREAQRQKQREAARHANTETIVLGPMRELHRLNGIWYQVDFLPLPSCLSVAPIARPCATGRIAPQRGGYDVLHHAWVVTGERYAARKRQLTTTELRQHKLSNLLA